jgi:hypothetical protein
LAKKNIPISTLVDGKFKFLNNFDMSQELYMSDIQEGEKKTERRDEKFQTNSNVDSKNKITKFSTAELISVTQSNRQMPASQAQKTVPKIVGLEKPKEEVEKKASSFQRKKM